MVTHWHGVIYLKKNLLNYFEANYVVPISFPFFLHIITNALTKFNFIMQDNFDDALGDGNRDI